MQQQQHPPRQQQFHEKNQKQFHEKLQKQYDDATKKLGKVQIWPLERIGNSFVSELSKIENDRDVWNLKNEDKVEIVYEPRRDNIVKKAVVEDIKNLSQAE